MGRLRDRPFLLALALFALGSAYAVQGPGTNQNAHFALVRSLARGHATVDRYRPETRDVSYFKGHYYAAKAPGLAFASLPAYEALRITGVTRLVRPTGRQRAILHPGTTRDNLVLEWALGLWAALLPALGLLLLVRSVADDLEPGYGAAAALTLGLATLLLPFAELYFDHSLSTFLGFAAFAALWRERRPAGWSPLRIAGAGALAACAVTAEYPLAIVAIALGLYALSKGQGLRRAAAYSAGFAIGIVPLLAYNAWAFGSATHISYEHAVSSGGASGHDALAANSAGLFGVRMPNLHVAAELLFANIGLLTITPVVACGVAGTVLLFRRGYRSEAVLIAGLAIAFVTYNSGYVLPFGGASPGPRFLLPVLPFLAVPLSLAYRRLPFTTLALATASAILITLITGTFATAAYDGRWDDRVRSAYFVVTIPFYLGVPRAIAVIPFFAALACAAFVAARTLPLKVPSRNEGLAAAVAVAVWAGLALASPPLLRSTAISRAASGAIVLGLAVAATLVTVATHRLPERRDVMAPERA